MSGELKLEDISALIDMALAEDLGTGDVTSLAIFNADHVSNALIVAKEAGVFCGGPVIHYVYDKIDSELHIELKIKEGQRVNVGDVVAEIKGKTISILAGERTVLNFIQRMSGICTSAARMTAELEGTGIKLLDTRKTLPGFRLIDKYSVKTGGGTNHRMGLYDMVMIKDNHIKSAGSISRAVELVREKHANLYKIEVEVTSQEETREAVAAGADIIMLDNMSPQEMKESVDIINKSAEIEISGNIDLERIKIIKIPGVDFVSVGALTHSVKAFDLSMKFL